MGVDIRLQIPPHVRFEEIAKLVGKFCGDPALQKKVYNKKIVDFNKPSGPNNSWSYEYDRLKPTSFTTLIRFEYEAFGSLHKSMSFHYDNDTCESRFLGYNLVSARANPLNIAICQRIVEQFGGYIQYADSSDDYDKHITDKKAILKRSDYIAEDSDIVYYRLINAIDEVKPMNKAQLQFGIDNAAYSIEETELNAVREWMILNDIKAEQIKLQEELPTQADTSVRPKRKAKI